MLGVKKNQPRSISMLYEFPFCHAHEHKSQVVKPSDVTPSSRNKGLGGGGTKFPLKKPLSLASKGMDKT